jgi:hypothetical protein
VLRWATVGSAKKLGWPSLADFRLAGPARGELVCELVLTKWTGMKGSWATWGRKDREKEREESAGQKLSAQKSYRKKLKFILFLGLNQILDQFKFEQILLELLN